MPYKIDLLIAIQRSAGCAGVSPIKDCREPRERWLDGDGDSDIDAWNLLFVPTVKPKYNPDLGKALKQFSRHANGSKALDVPSVTISRKRLHRRAEMEACETVWHFEDPGRFRRNSRGFEIHDDPLTWESMAGADYTAEESARVFHAMWHGSGEDER